MLCTGSAPTGPPPTGAATSPPAAHAATASFIISSSDRSTNACNGEQQRSAGGQALPWAPRPASRAPRGLHSRRAAQGGQASAPSSPGGAPSRRRRRPSAPPPNLTAPSLAVSAESAWQAHAARCALHQCTGSAMKSLSSTLTSPHLRSIWRGCAECRVSSAAIADVPCDSSCFRC